MTRTLSNLNVKGFFTKISSRMGKLGAALLFPIATLPFAAILLRIGAQLPMGTPFADFVKKMVITGGDVVFSNLPMIFAIGIAFGFAKDKRGEAALSAFIGMTLLMVIMSKEGVDLAGKIYAHSKVDFHSLFGAKYDDVLSKNVLNGVVAGSLVAYLYNKFNKTQLPTALGFFSGRRLIPVLAISTIFLFGIIYAIVFPWIGWLIYKFSEYLETATGNRWANSGIMFIYGIINRLLLPFGLHHIPNTLFWFQLGSFPSETGQALVHGDINIFLQGIAKGNTAGTFQSGFFPIMMFGLPALALAFYFTAENKSQKLKVFSIFGGAALVSFLTGITEPIEFAFLFISPVLFLFHAFATGLFGFITGLFGIQLGFGFSAGLIDYILSFPKSLDIIQANKVGINAVMANPLWILFVIGPLAGLTYFFGAKWAITKFNLSTPGRGDNLIADANEDKKVVNINSSDNPVALDSKKIILALGGKANIKSFTNCATRLRFELKDNKIVDKELIKQTKALGQVKVASGYQVIIGPKVEAYADVISDLVEK